MLNRMTVIVKHKYGLQGLLQGGKLLILTIFQEKICKSTISLTFNRFTGNILQGFSVYGAFLLG